MTELFNFFTGARRQLEPIRDTNATLVDLLDRILDKGLVINADVIISVAGIPLIGVNLRAALAGMETMLKYGMMQAWDEKIRSWEREHRKRQEISLFKGEKIKFKMFGSYYYSKGIYTAWISGYIYLTNKRLLLWNREFDEITFQIPLEKIRAIIMNQEVFLTREKKEVLYLVDQDNKVSRLHAVENDRLKKSIEQKINAMGLTLEENHVLPEFEKGAVSFLREGEMVTSRGKVWHLVSGKGIIGTTWKSGYLYLTNKRLFWWDDFEQRIDFQVSVEKINAAVKERRDMTPVLKNENVLDVIFNANGTRSVASFSGKEIDEWKIVINSTLAKVSQAVEERETCPQCGNIAAAKELLEKGCSKCAWVSPRQQEKLKAKN